MRVQIPLESTFVSWLRQCHIIMKNFCSWNFSNSHFRFNKDLGQATTLNKFQFHLCTPRAFTAQNFANLSVTFPTNPVFAVMNFNASGMPTFKLRLKTGTHCRHLVHVAQVNLKVAPMIALIRAPRCGELSGCSAVWWLFRCSRRWRAKMMVRNEVWISYKERSTALPAQMFIGQPALWQSYN